MQRVTFRQRAAGYGLAAALCSLALALRFALGGTTNLVFVTFYPAVMASGWWGGRGPVLLSVALCALTGDYFFMDPRGRLAPGSLQGWTNLLLFVAVGSAVGLVTARLRHVQSRFRSVLELTSDGFAIVARDWRFLYANPRIAAMVGMTVHDLVNRSVWEVFPEAADLPFEAAAREAMEGRRSGYVAFNPRFGRWFEASIYPVPEGIAILSRDVSAARELEARRTEQLSELEAANQIKDEFLATLSHELRTPLNSVMGWAQMLRNGATTPERAIGAIERNAASLKQLVDDLLDTSSIVSGKLHLDSRSTDFARVVREAVEMVRPPAELRRTTLVVQGTNVSILVHGDAARLQQAVLNLLSNAVKFTPEDGRITVALAAGPAVVTLTVRDTGIGIDAALLPRIFERFVQADAPIATRKGLGLGLAIAKHIVEVHGGTLAAESEGPMRGAQFTLTLPRVDQGSA